MNPSQSLRQVSVAMRRGWPVNPNDLDAIAVRVARLERALDEIVADAAEEAAAVALSVNVLPFRRQGGA